MFLNGFKKNDILILFFNMKIKLFLN